MKFDFNRMSNLRKRKLVKVPGKARFIRQALAERNFNIKTHNFDYVGSASINKCRNVSAIIKLRQDGDFRPC